MGADFTLAVFAKAPAPGQVKTRFRPAVDDEQVSRLAAAFVQDTLQKAARLGPPVTVYFAGDCALLEPLAPPLILWADQGGGDLGARMARVPAPCLLLGADSPHLPPSLLRAALAAVPNYDVVLGPAEDGGYFLLGLRAPSPPCSRASRGAPARSWPRRWQRPPRSACPSTRRRRGTT